MSLQRVTRQTAELGKLCGLDFIRLVDTFPLPEQEFLIKALRDERGLHLNVFGVKTKSICEPLGVEIAFLWGVLEYGEDLDEEVIPQKSYEASAEHGLSILFQYMIHLENQKKS